MSKKNRAVKKVKKVSELKKSAVSQSIALSRCLNSPYFKKGEFRNVGKNLISYIEEGEYQGWVTDDVYALDMYLDKVQMIISRLASTLDELQERTKVK